VASAKTAACTPSSPIRNVPPGAVSTVPSNGRAFGSSTPSSSSQATSAAPVSVKVPSSAIVRVRPVSGVSGGSGCSGSPASHRRLNSSTGTHP
jgi:hypothetical protein